MKKIAKFLSLMLIILILSSCKKENDLIYDNNQINNFLLNIDSLLEEESHTPYMIFSNRPSEHDSSSLLYWLDSDKIRRMNPILLVVERSNSEKNELMHVVISTKDNKYCLIRNTKEAIFPDSCDIFNEFRIIYPSDGDMKIYLSRERQDILLFELKNENAE